MKNFRLITAMMMGLALSACASVETASRNTPLDATQVRPAVASFNIQAIRVNVPQSLKVSEANRYYPGGDIVWRGEPLGDRHAQVKAIFETAIRKGVDASPKGKVPATLDVEVTRFHALTEKARYTTGGVHSLQFKYVLRNPKTGEAYGAPKFIKADFKAFGGEKAVEAENKGITQKYRITNHLANVFHDELSNPQGYKKAHLGLIGAINQM